MKLQQIADHLGCRVDGDGDLDIVRVSNLHDAGHGDLTFLTNARYLPQLASTRASAVIVGTDLVVDMPAGCAILRTNEPYVAFARAVGLLSPLSAPPRGIDRLCSIAADAAIAADVSIGPFVVIGAGASIGARTVLYPNVVIGPSARIGDDCVIHSHVTVREGAAIGNRVVLHDGVVIGSDGFGFATQSDGTHVKIPQHAAVVVEDDVEIGANSTIDRPAVGETRIGAGTKIDNLVHVAHGVRMGRRVLLAAQVGIAGSTTIGDDVMMGGQTGVIGHVTVGSRAKIGAKSAVLQAVEPGAFVTGHPAFEHTEWRKASTVFRRLPALKKRVEELGRIVAALEARLARRRGEEDR